MSNLAQRLLTAVIAIPLLIYIFWLGGPWALGLIVLVNLLGLDEFFGLMEGKGMIPLRLPGLLSGTLLVIIAYVSNEYYMTITLTLAILVVLISQMTRADIKSAITGISATLFAIVYVSFLLSHALLMRNIEKEIDGRPGLSDYQRWDTDLGFFLVIYTLVATFLADAGAYFAGRAYGKRPLAPRISPKKTVEGFIGGVITASIGSMLCGIVFGSPFPWYFELTLGLVLGAAGTLGDLAESLVKRDADIKDAGSLLPGHGGLLDRLDSILFTFPVCYYGVKIFLYLQVHSVWDIPGAFEGP